MAAVYTIVRSIVQDLFATLEPFLRGLVENFRAGLSKSVNEAFRVGFIDAHFHANTAVEGITLRILGGVASEDGCRYTTREDFVDPVGDP